MKRFPLLVLASSIVLSVLLLQHRGQELTTRTALAAANAATVVHLPALFNNHNPQFPAPLFGVQAYGSTDVTSPDYPYLVGSQASWVRSSVNWEIVEPANTTPDQFAWSSADSSLAIAREDKGGLEVIAVIADVPEWARLPGQEQNSGPVHPDRLADFAEFVRATVERYDGDGFQDAAGGPVVQHWEIFNEPDGDIRWGGYGPEYAEMLKVVYPAIKSANPRAQVLLGGLAYDWFDDWPEPGPFDSDFLTDVLDNGGGDYFDIMNFHIYPAFAAAWGSKDIALTEKTAAIRSILADYDLEKPMVVTEAGWHNNTDIEPASSDREQIARLMQFMAESYATDIKVLIWWTLSDPGGFVLDFGLVTNDNPPVAKPAYSAYQTAVSMLESSTFERRIAPREASNGSSLEAYQFNNNGRPLYVAWVNPYDTNEVQPLTIWARAANVINGQGVVIETLTDGDGDGLITVDVNANPVYIEVTQ